MRILNESALLVKFLLEEEDGWIGVDLDGTLARYTGWKGSTKIGKPIPRMVRRVRRWVSHGRKVKIFTARADDEKSVNAIKKWLKANKLPDLEVTNLKDASCVEIWDDRAKAVEKNTGRLKESLGIICEAVDPKRVFNRIKGFKPGDTVRRGEWSYDQSEGTLVREISGFNNGNLRDQIWTVLWPQYQSEVRASDLVLVHSA